MGTTEVVSQVDARGLVCPMPTIRLGQAIRKLEIGQLVEVWTDDPGSKETWPRGARTPAMSSSTTRPMRRRSNML
jgi:TusA-related sulfurtransferase